MCGVQGIWICINENCDGIHHYYVSTETYVRHYYRGPK